MKNLRKITSLLLVLTFVVLLFGPATANAASIGVSGDKKSENVVYQAVGSSASAKMRESLSRYNIPVKDDTKLEIVKAKDEEGTILYVTNQEGALITKSVLMAVDEEGNLKSFTAEDVARSTPDLSGGGNTVNPFNDSFQIIFTIGFYGYRYNTDDYGVVQPQLAIFRYVDSNNLYTVSSLVMNYDCYGLPGNFDGTNFTATPWNPLEAYKYRITVSQTNPIQNTYYSSYPEDAIASNKAVQLFYSPGGEQLVVYTLTGRRNSTGAAINITREVMLNIY